MALDQATVHHGFNIEDQEGWAVRHGISGSAGL